jgi:hypothetical protein
MHEASFKIDMLFLKDLDYEDIFVFDTKMVILKKIHLCFT